MSRFLHQFDRRVTTPQVLTEVDNLLAPLRRQEPVRYRRAMEVLIDGCEETVRPAHELVRQERYELIGMTDTSIGQAAHGAATVLTDDTMLAYHLSMTGIAVVNFNHVRDQLRMRRQ